MFVFPQLLAWSETNLAAIPQDLAAARRKNPKVAQQALRNVPPILAVTVSESSGAMPRDQFHRAPMQTDSEPVMVVFGDASWVSNQGLNNSDNLNLFASCLSWLRGKPDLGPSPEDAKSRQTYSLRLNKPDELSRLVWWPLFITLIGVVVLGGGVWLVRRR